LAALLQADPGSPGGSDDGAEIVLTIGAVVLFLLLVLIFAAIIYFNWGSPPTEDEATALAHSSDGSNDSASDETTVQGPDPSSPSPDPRPTDEAGQGVEIERRTGAEWESPSRWEAPSEAPVDSHPEDVLDDTATDPSTSVGSTTDISPDAEDVGDLERTGESPETPTDLRRVLQTLHARAGTDGVDRTTATPMMVDPWLLPFQKTFARELLDTVGQEYVPRRLRADLLVFSAPHAVRSFFESLHLSFDAIRSDRNPGETSAAPSGSVVDELGRLFDLLETMDETGRHTPLPDAPLYAALRNRDVDAYRHQQQRYRKAAEMWEVTRLLSPHIPESRILRTQARRAARQWPDADDDDLDALLQRCRDAARTNREIDHLRQQITGVLNRTDERLPVPEVQPARREQSLPSLAEHPARPGDQTRYRPSIRALVQSRMVRRTTRAMHYRILRLALAMKRGSLSPDAMKTTLRRTVLESAVLLDEAERLWWTSRPESLRTAFDTLALHPSPSLSTRRVRQAFRRRAAGKAPSSDSFLRLRTAYFRIRDWMASDDASDALRGLTDRGPDLVAGFLADTEAAPSASDVVARYTNLDYSPTRPG
jgi:hypothetical protein